MASPSSSLNSDLIVAIDIAKRIVDTYFDDFSEAPPVLADLLRTIKFIHEVLIESINFLRQCNRTFLGQQRFIRKLDQCGEFIHRHSSRELTPVEARGGLDLQPAWTTVAQPDLRTGQMINDGLQVEMEKVITFIFLVAIKASDNPPSISASAFRISGHLEPASSNVEDIVRRLSSLRKKAERRRNIAQSHGQSPDLADLVAGLNEQWNLLCLKAGFIQMGRNTPLPGRENPNGLLLSSNQGLIDEMIINLSRSSLHYPMNSRRESVPTLPSNLGRREFTHSPVMLAHGPRSAGFIPQSPAASVSVPPSLRSIPRSPGQISIPRTLPDQHQMSLGEPALPVCVATWLISDRKGLKLQHWRLENHLSAKAVVWRGVDPAYTLTHLVPSGAIPYTKHISLRQGKSHNGYTVGFDTKHKIVWTKNGEIKADEERGIEYHFVEKRDYERFQEDIRDKHLLDVFNIDTIRTRKSGSYGDAGNQDLKIWCSRDERELYTMSFLANHAEQQQREYPIRWFTANAKFDDHVGSAELVFAADPYGESGSGRRRSSILSRGISFGRGATKKQQQQQQQQQQLPSSSNASARASMSTIASSLSGHSVIDVFDHDFAPQKMAETLEYVRIIFTPNSADNTDVQEDDYQRFKKMWQGSDGDELSSQRRGSNVSNSGDSVAMAGLHDLATRPWTPMRQHHHHHQHCSVDELASASIVELGSIPVSELDATSTARGQPRQVYELPGDNRYGTPYARN